MPKVGTQDNFFEMGGHSLLATQVLLRLRERIQIESAIASLLRSANGGGAGSGSEKSLAAEIDALSEEEAQRLDQAIELSSKS